MLELVTTQQTGLDQPQQITGAKYRTLEEFTAFLNREPVAEEIKTNPAAKGAKYIPIGVIQTKLDEVFAGAWKTINFRYTAVANELCGTITLEFFHPILQMWLTREGSAAVMIRQNSGASITDLEQKLKNGLTMDVPHLQSSCLAAAARTLGKTFGRDLNRKLDMIAEYNAIYSNMADDKIVDGTGLKAAETKEQLLEIYKSLPEEFRAMEAVKRAYKFRLSQLKQGGTK